MIFKCKNCGGNVVYEPGRGRMYCPHCESEDSEEKIQGGTLAQCVNCGAPLEVQDYTSASRCGHCGSYIVFNERVEGVYEPHLLLPFYINKKAAVEALHREFSRRLFTPSDFLSAKSLEKMEGIYVPFWLYDYKACYDYTGEGVRVRTWTSGNTEYTERSYFEVVRKMELDFDRVPVDASYAMEDGIMDLMEPYDYGQLQGFDPKYMSGFYGEVYNQEASQLEDRAREKSRSAAEELMQESLHGYTTIKPLHRNLDLRGTGTRYALMPVWQYLYRYKGEVYQYHVNGQTGKVIGTTPVSMGKVLGYSASVFAVVTAVCCLAVRVLEIL